MVYDFSGGWRVAGGRGARVRVCVWGREMYTRGHTAKQKHGVGRVLTTKRVQACARARRIFRTRKRGNGMWKRV